MPRIIGLFVLLALMLAACAPGPGPDEGPPPEPRALLTELIVNLREVQSFRMLIEQVGAPYQFAVSLDEGLTTVGAIMRRGEAQYETPNVIYALVNLRIGGLPPIGVELFARGLDQWFKLASSRWINYPIADGFDPGTLIQEDSGFSAAMNALRELTYVSSDNLVDGTPVHHVRGEADGQLLNDLLFNLLDVREDRVIVDVYVNRETTLPALLVVTLPDTATETEDDIQWRIELYDYDAESTIAYPDETIE